MTMIEMEIKVIFHFLFAHSLNPRLMKTTTNFSSLWIHRVFLFDSAVNKDRTDLTEDTALLIHYPACHNHQEIIS